MDGVHPPWSTKVLCEFDGNLPIRLDQLLFTSDLPPPLLPYSGYGCRRVSTGNNKPVGVYVDSSSKRRHDCTAKKLNSAQLLLKCQVTSSR